MINKSINKSDKKDLIKESKAIIPSPKSNLRIETNQKIEENALSLYGKDLTESAKKGLLDPVIGREDEINNLMRVLSRRSKNNPILIGYPGVGKTSIAKLLAQLIVDKKVPDSLKNLKIISLDLGALVSGTKFRGQLEERLSLILNEIKNSNQGIILFIDEIHTIISSDRSTTDISNILKPLLTEGELRCIGTTTPEKFRESIERDQALNNCFQKILVNEPSVELTAEILKGIKKKYELHHGIRITEEAINSSARLADRYISDKCLPDKAIDLIDEAAAQLKIESNIKPQIILAEESKIDDIENKLKNLSPENIKDREKLLESKELATNKLNEIINDWNNDKEKMEQLTFLLKEEDRLILKIEELRINIEEINNFDSLNNLEEELNEVEFEIKTIESSFKKPQRNKNLILNIKLNLMILLMLYQK